MSCDPLCSPSETVSGRIFPIHPAARRNARHVPRPLANGWFPQTNKVAIPSARQRSIRLLQDFGLSTGQFTSKVRFHATIGRCRSAISRGSCRDNMQLQLDRRKAECLFASHCCIAKNQSFSPHSVSRGNGGACLRSARDALRPITRIPMGARIAHPRETACGRIRRPVAARWGRTGPHH